MTHTIKSLKRLKSLLPAIAMVFLFSCKKEGEIGDQQKDAFVKFYGTSSYDQGFDIKQTADGGFVILGNTNRPGKRTDISLIKTDAFGNIEWERNYGGRGSDEGKSFQIESNGGFIITGFFTRVDSAGEALDKDICLIKTDPMGNEVWPEPRLFGNADNNEEGRGILITDNGYLIGANTDSLDPNLDFSSDIQVYQTNFNGELNSNVVTRGRPGADILNGIIKIGSFVMFIGNTQSGKPNLAFPNVLMAKFDPSTSTNDFKDAEYNRSLETQSENSMFGVENNGNLVLINNITTSGGSSSIEVVEMQLGEFTNQAVWSEIYEIDNKTTTGSSIEKTSDGGYIISGTVEAANADKNLFILKISENGTREWHKEFGSLNQNEQGENVIQTPDNGYLTLGTAGLAPNDPGRIRNSTVMLIKTTTNGELK